MSGEEQERPKISEIPAGWHFPEQSKPDLEPIIIDQEGRFLAFQFPESTVHTAYGDYFFDVNGNPISFRIYRETYNGFNIRIKFNGDITKRFEIDELPRSEPIARIQESAIGQGLLPISFGISFAVSFKNHDPNLRKTNLGGLNFDPFDGRLGSVDLGDVFKQNPDGTIIEFPKYLLVRDMSSDGNELRDWKLDNELVLGSPSYTYELRDENHVLISEKGGNIYEIDWDFDDIGGIVVRETHLPSGTQKILRSTRKVNPSQILSMAIAKPPYQKKSVGKLKALDIPWEHLDRFVKVNFSYIENPQQQVEEGDNLE